MGAQHYGPRDCFGHFWLIRPTHLVKKVQLGQSQVTLGIGVSLPCFLSSLLLVDCGDAHLHYIAWQSDIHTMGKFTLVLLNATLTMSNH